jgi:hypothetical protein
VTPYNFVHRYRRFYGTELFHFRSTVWSRNKNLINNLLIRFEVFTAVTMKNGVFWDVQEPHGVTSQKMPFFKRRLCLRKSFDNINDILEESVLSIYAV